MRDFILLCITATGACGPMGSSSDKSTNSRIASECGVPVADVERVKAEALNWKALETRPLGKCEIVRGDDGDDVFILDSNGVFLDDANLTQDAGS